MENLPNQSKTKRDQGVPLHSESVPSSSGLSVPVPSKRCSSCLLRPASCLEDLEEDEGEGSAPSQASSRRCSRASRQRFSSAFFCCSSAICRSTSSSSASTVSNCSWTSEPETPAAFSLHRQGAVLCLQDSLRGIGH